MDTTGIEGGGVEVGEWVPVGFRLRFFRTFLVLLLGKIGGEVVGFEADGFRRRFFRTFLILEVPEHG